MKHRSMHTRLLVSNFKASFNFYGNLLGLNVIWGDVGSEYAAFQTGETVITIFRQSHMAEITGKSHLPPKVNCQDRFALIFPVDDIDKTYLELKIQGVPVMTEPVEHKYWKMRTIHLRDPDGNLIEIFSKMD